ncbi:glycosyltransferase family 4 protein [Sediminibacterium roseum]|uniref:Glycosyltransferase family 4 protein n=1 Tax=Sediminibacterium roseum TaxID=1978412 RepID=A0ABW9ZU17_9BACT|nr:glycosyltransferase family 4 protein [Sediminibacterium roseum]NCI50620.1 glycosyltransferase family 4 protein [Sediminibacterium roseum]
MNFENQTLVILSPGFPANEADSTCLPAQQAFLRALNREFPGVSVVVLAFQYPFSETAYTWHGNRILPLNGRNRNKLHRWFLWYKAWGILKNLHKKEKIAGVFSFWLDECAFVGATFCKRKNIPHFTWLLGQDARPGNRYVRLLKPAASSLVAMSDLLARTFYENYGIRPANVIPNGIDPSLYPNPAAKRDIDVIGVGSLIPLKQFDVFIAVVKQLRSHLPGINVLICGKGPEHKKLEQLIIDNSLQQNISLTGEIKHEEILSLLQRSRIMLHTSAYEGFSGACLEALYAGAHVISFFSPQDAWIRHWHIAENSDEMAALALEILQSVEIDHKPVLPYKMSDTAKSIMQLFAGKQLTGSH